MTQPDQYFPDTAINASPGFAAYAATTQEEYEQQLRDRTTGAFSSISGLCALIQELPFMSGLEELGGGGGVFGILQGIQDFADSMCGLATGTPSSDTSPQTVIAGVSNASETAQASTVFNQLMDLGGGGSGNILLDLLAGVEAFFNSVLGIFTGSGDVTDLLDVLGQIPLIGDLIRMFQGQTTNADGDLFGGLLGQLSNTIHSILSMLGLGDIFGGGVPGGGDTGGGGGTPGSGDFDLFGALFGFISGILGAVGGITSGTSILGGQLGTLGPSTANNVQPDFPVIQQAMHGQGHWIWDWPANDGAIWGSGSGCVRTRRPGTITIFWVNGTWEPVEGGAGVSLDIPGGGITMGDPKTMLQRQWSDHSVTEQDWLDAVAANAATVPVEFGDNILDWSKFDVVSVPYAGALYPMGHSVDGGVKNLIQLIKLIPGKFILIGASMGGVVTSRVYRDEILNPNGSLHNRNDDLLMGVCIGNPMRKAGTTFPGAPVFCSDGHGVLLDNLTTVDERWWEWSLGAGTYPAFDRMDGITYLYGDPISCLDDSELSGRVRALADESYAMKTLSPNVQTDFMLMVLGKSIFDAEAANVLLGIGFVETQSPHGGSSTMVQPFLADDDHRNFWRIVVDHINDTFSELASPPTNGVAHEMEGLRVNVKGLQVLHARVETQWMNFVTCEGPAIILGINCYDAAGHWIPGALNTSPTIITPDATITDPNTEATWQTLSASFVMPQNAVTACMALRVEPIVMVTGTVWFRNPYLEVTDVIDAALLTQMENFPQITAHQVGGVQGEDDMLSMLQTLIDKMTLANQGGEELTDVQLASLFASQGVTAANALEALTLAVAHEQTLTQSHEPVYVGFSPAGEVTFPLDSFPQGTALPTTAVTPGTAFAGFITTKAAVTKEFVEFIATRSGTGAIYVNVYDVDTATGDWTNIFTSADISASIPTGDPGWVELDVDVSFAVTAGQLLAIEIVAQGSATVMIASKTSPIPAKSAIPAGFGAARVTASTGGPAPATLDVSELVYGQEMPYFCTGVASLPPLFHAAEQVYIDTVGQTLYDIPEWAQVSGAKLDIVSLGGGGAGTGPDGLPWNVGIGGLEGEWNAATKTYGTDIPGGTTQLIAVVGAGGVGTYGGGALDGSPTIIGYGDFPTFDSVGTGVWNAYGGESTTHSWTQNATAGAYVLAAVLTTGWDITVTGVTYDGVAMDLIADEEFGWTGYEKLVIYGLDNAPGGSKTVVATTSGDADATANSVAYLGVSSVGTPQIGVSGTWELGQILVNVLGLRTGQITTPYGGEHRWTGKCTDLIGNGVLPMTISDAYGNTTFGNEDLANPLAQYSSIIIPLIGSGATVLTTADGGVGGGSSNQMGHGAGVSRYNLKNYFGGGDVYNGSTGAIPGGGGAGSVPWYETGVTGGSGGAWITARQS